MKIPSLLNSFLAYVYQSTPLRLLFFMQAQVTVAILLNSFVGAITAAEEEAAQAACANMKSKEMLRLQNLHVHTMQYAHHGILEKGF